MTKIECIQEVINNLPIPMPSIDDELYITQDNLSKLLGISAGCLNKTYNNRKDEFDAVSANIIRANEFLKQHKHLLGIKRVRKDMHLWTEDDMLTFGMLVRGPRGRHSTPRLSDAQRGVL